MDAKDYVQRLNEILEKKFAALSEILSCTRLQKDAIGQHNDNELEILIAKKQERMEAIDKLDEQFSVYIARLKSAKSINSLEELPKFNLPGTADIKKNVQRIYDILEEIRAIDKNNSAQVQSELLDVKEKIKQSNKFQQVNQAYNLPKTELPAYYFDKKK